MQVSDLIEVLRRQMLNNGDMEITINEHQKNPDKLTDKLTGIDQRNISVKESPDGEKFLIINDTPE